MSEVIKPHTPHTLPSWAKSSFEAHESSKSPRPTFPSCHDDIPLRSGLRKGVLRYKRIGSLRVEAPDNNSVSFHTFHPSSRYVVVCCGSANPLVQLYAVENLGKYTLDSSVRVAADRVKFVPQDALKLACLNTRNGRFCQIDMETSSMVTEWKRLDDPKVRSFDIHSSSSLAAFSGEASGIITLVDLRSNQSVGRIFNAGMSRTVDFDATDKMLWSCSDAEVFLWDMRRMGVDGQAGGSCLLRHTDTGGVRIESFALCAKYYAVGSDSGAVSLYDREGSRTTAVLVGNQSATHANSSATIPFGEILNLRSPVNVLCFDPHSEYLLYASNTQKNAVRLYSMNSKCTISNFPSRGAESVGRIHSVAFSPLSKELTLGSSNGMLYTYDINR